MDETAAPPGAVNEAWTQAWRSRDAVALAGLVADDVTWRSPLGAGGREALVGTAAAVFAALPDLSLVDVVEIPGPDGRGALRWTLTGTDAGGFGGWPPTGRRVALPVGTFLETTGGLVSAAESHWDHRLLLEQLGLHVVAMPPRVGPFRTGTAAKASSGRRTRPGAVSLTWLVTRTPEEADAFVRFTRERVVPELLTLPGFLDFIGGTFGSWHFTLTAWESPEAVRGLASLPSHREGIRWFFRPGDEGVGAQGFTSVWVPGQLNTLWVRCSGCGHMVAADDTTSCADCGAALPERLPYW